MKTDNQRAIVIGAGFSGLAAAATLAKSGYQVDVLEKNESVGGRARVFKKDGFTFDMGPSWYWMPEIMEGFFNEFGRSAAEFFKLHRLDPSYQIFFAKDDAISIPANFEELLRLFESIEKGSAGQLIKFLDDARLKYDTGMGTFVRKPGLSILEFMNPSLILPAIKMNLFQSFADHVRKYFKSEKLLQLLEFPVLFLGAEPKNIPALYSMMNYADIKLGTWYPMGGFGKLPEAMQHVAEDQGVVFHFAQCVKSLTILNGKVTGVKTDRNHFDADVVISSADYHFTEQELIPAEYRNYSDAYWQSRTMAPSCLLYYVGIDKKIAKLQHHNLFFEENFASHAKSIYEVPSYPENPLFYVCCPGKTDRSVAPEGKENLFLLIPIAPGLDETPGIRKKYFDETISRLEEFCGESIADHVISYTDYAGSNFIDDYNAFKGNAYGLANTLRQTAILKPSIRNKRLPNLYYTGQLTVPGPGVPPSIISGQIVAAQIIKTHAKKTRYESIV